MWYLKVKEEMEAPYRDMLGGYYNVYQTDIKPEASEEDLCECVTVESALDMFNLLTEEAYIKGLVNGIYFDAEKVINRAFELLGVRAYDLGAYHFMICDSMRKRAFKVLRYNLTNLRGLGKITQADLDAVSNALLEQNINLNDYA